VPVFERAFPIDPSAVIPIWCPVLPALNMRLRFYYRFGQKREIRSSIFRSSPERTLPADQNIPAGRKAGHNQPKLTFGLICRSMSIWDDSAGCLVSGYL